MELFQKNNQLPGVVVGAGVVVVVVSTSPKNQKTNIVENNYFNIQ